MKNILRHGDVLLLGVDAIPEAAIEQKRCKEMTIALGEATGHHHTLYGSIPDAVVLRCFDDRRFLEINEPLVLRHQEHKELPVEIGNYEIIIEKERDPWAKKMREVLD